jgi:hypothetical protein
LVAAVSLGIDLGVNQPMEYVLVAPAVRRALEQRSQVGLLQVEERELVSTGHA